MGCSSLGEGPEPIAIIGVGCRFPGADGPEAFWELLRDGIDAIGEMPPERWDIPAYYDPQPGTPGKMNTRCGGFLQDVDRFDAALFGLSPREAECMDPQQRILLEVAYAALEDAACAGDEAGDQRTGVFIGMCYSDYEDLMFRQPSALDLYVITGGSRFSAAGRQSVNQGLRGPSLMVDTACS